MTTTVTTATVRATIAVIDGSISERTFLCTPERWA